MFVIIIYVLSNLLTTVGNKRPVLFMVDRTWLSDFTSPFLTTLPILNFANCFSAFGTLVSLVHATRQTKTLIIDLCEDLSPTIGTLNSN